MNYSPKRSTKELKDNRSSSLSQKDIDASTVSSKYKWNSHSLEISKVPLFANLMHGKSFLPSLFIALPVHSHCEQAKKSFNFNIIPRTKQIGNSISKSSGSSYNAVKDDAQTSLPGYLQTVSGENYLSYLSMEAKYL